MKMNLNGFLAGLVAVVVFTGGVVMSSGATKKAEEATNEPPIAKGGAQLWAENCQRCHNIRSPASYSPKQWEVVMIHMKAVGGLTDEETKAILEFLKSSS